MRQAWLGPYPARVPGGPANPLGVRAPMPPKLSRAQSPATCQSSKPASSVGISLKGQKRHKIGARQIMLLPEHAPKEWSHRERLWNEATRDAFDNLRIRRPMRLLLSTIAQSCWTSRWRRASAHSNPICLLARTGMALREAAEPAPHAESSGTDADRHRVIAGDAWICRTWNYAAVSRGQTPDAASDFRIRVID